MTFEDRFSLPDPGWDPVSEGYWLAARKGELVVQQCQNCGVHRWPPAWACYSCQSLEWVWDGVAGTGTVFTYTWADQRPAEVDDYNIAVVELDGAVGQPVRIMSRVMGVDRSTLCCDMRVVVVFQEIDDDVAIPFFERS